MEINNELTQKVVEYVTKLTDYAIEKELCTELDRVYVQNRLMSIFGITEFYTAKYDSRESLEEILYELSSCSSKLGLLDIDSVTERDLFTDKLMDVFMPRPSDVIEKFNRLYEGSPKEATDYFYALSNNSDYIKTYRVEKDIKWKYAGKYGDLDITINLSKPEKDPKAIAAAKNQAQTSYPKCALCHENEGFSGDMSRAPRVTIRQIPVNVGGDTWYLQYSPYVYYNEHCILLSDKHEPMKISRKTLERQLDFVDRFKHYFIGSNADLPIVGGSILTHDHMQGGSYVFAMQKADIEVPLTFKGYEEIEAGIVKWPMATIRLRSVSKERLIDLAERIINKWRSYTDENAFIFSETNGEPHNTVTPYARMAKDGERFEVDLVLRNNITTEEHPLGVYHPHADKHNIKRENIGLIEVMGLAILPARLKAELSAVAEKLASGDTLIGDPLTEKHSEWAESFRNNYTFTKDNAEEIVKKEVGRTFEAVLEDSGVYKLTSDGRNAFKRFVDAVNSR